MRLEHLTCADFEPHVGGAFVVEHEAARDLVLVLVEARAAPAVPARAADGRRGRPPFSLLFRGPARPHLAQSIRRLRGPEPLGVLDLFLVPVGPCGDGTGYEAVFA